MTLIKNISGQTLAVYNDDDAGAKTAEPGGTIDVPDPDGYVESGLWALDAPAKTTKQVAQSSESPNPASADSTPKEG